MNKLILKSPAKLNLYLDVLKKRPDGYHDIRTIFEKIALFDRITLRKEKKGIRITTNDPRLPLGSGNIAYKAAKAVFGKAGFTGGVSIDIKKAIPVAAGLGGGSSNAACVLAGLNRLYDLGISPAGLVNIGKTLGADVPFFLYGHNFALGTGRGDEIAPIKSNIIIWHIIVSFNFGVATKSVYNDPNLRLTPRAVDVKMSVRSIKKNDIENLATSLYNRLEQVVLQRIKVVGLVKALLLEEGAYSAILSGSGPTLFGITRTRKEAMGVKNRIEKSVHKRIGKVFVVSTMDGVSGKE